MRSNIAEFTAGLDRWGEDVKQIHLDQQKAIAFEGARGLVEMTPVDTGRAKGNWQVTEGEPASGVLETTDKTGAETLRKAQSVIAGIRAPFGIFWITNNVAYIEELERGHSTQAPSGMLARTYQRLLTIRVRATGARALR